MVLDRFRPTIFRLYTSIMAIIPQRDAFGIHEPTPHRYVGNVGLPYLIGFSCLPVLEQIGVYKGAFFFFTQIGFGIDCLKSHLPIEPSDALFIDSIAQFIPQVAGHSSQSIANPKDSLGKASPRKNGHPINFLSIHSINIRFSPDSPRGLK